MKNHFFCALMLFLCYTSNSFSQDGNFTFTLPYPANTSAGVFKLDGTLVKTLWNNVNYQKGTFTKTWDGKDDAGESLSSPDQNYQIKVLTNNVQYEWQGTVGNSSSRMTGPTKHRGLYHCMRGLVFTDKFGYYCTGYSEGLPSIAKFSLSNPEEKIYMSTYHADKADNNYVATDNNYVYWGAFDSNSPNNTFVHATKVSDDAEVNFSRGTSYTVIYGRKYQTIANLDKANSLITGLAVQKSGNYLFVARAKLNELQVINKATGELIKKISFSQPRGVSVDNNGNIWLISQSNYVAHYRVNNDGSLQAPDLSLNGLLNPLSTQVSYDGDLVSVTDGKSSQQVKFFYSSNGNYAKSLGSEGGYINEPTVENNKFYFEDPSTNLTPNPRLLAFTAFQPDGSIWVNDPGNFRVQHFNANMSSFTNRIMSLGAKYTVFVDRNNIKKVFADFLEFEIDYGVQTLTGSNGWILKKNWGAVIPTTPYQGSPRFETTLSNQKTYGFIRNSNDWEVVEFPTSGAIRFTGVKLHGLTKILCNDGSLQDYTTQGKKATLKRYPLLGFDGNNNPVWDSKGEFLVEATVDNQIGNPVEFPNNQVFSTTTDKIVFFNHKAYADDDGPVYSKGYHLGLMKRGTKNSFMAQTEKSTHRNYEGNYPNAGFFDVGNMVNDYAGGNVNIIDRSIITSYHGEFWKNSQTNKFNHYYDNGLAVGQFGTTRPEVKEQSAEGMAGNALTPIVVKDEAGDLYLFHGDESDHAGVHRWKITGLNTIKEDIISISFPSSYTQPTPNYLDLMKGLPYDEVLKNNTAGWTRYPTDNDEEDVWEELWRVNTSRLSYEKLTSNDIAIEFLDSEHNTSYVKRDLGSNLVTKDWKITGEISYPSDNNINGIVCQQFLEVLDQNEKILTTFYIADSGGTQTKIYGNNVIMYTALGSINVQQEITRMLPFEVKVTNGMATFSYGSYPSVTASISNPSGDWKTPKTLRIRFINNGNSGPVRKQTIGIKDFKFYKDYTEPSSINQPPVANAGDDQVISGPLPKVTLQGSGNDPDGSITNYSWAKISGSSSGLLANIHAAVTLVTGLEQGIHQYELTVTDDKGAIAKDIVQITVNAPLLMDFGLNLLPALNPANTVNGLDYKYYEGKWDHVPDFNQLSAVKTGNINQFDLSPTNRSDLYGFSFTGYINVPKDGQYTFYTTSDDGSILYIDDVLTVTNDGLHGAQERSGMIGLKAGKHAIRAFFFEQGGDEIFSVHYEGSSLSKQLIPASELFRIAPVSLLPAVYPANPVNGLDYSYYEGRWSVMPAFTDISPVKTGTTQNFDIKLANQDDLYAFSFKGYIDVPADGQYTFFTTSDDGSRLYIDDVLTVDNDGLHGSQEKSGSIGLKAGKHAITGLFFEQGGDQVFQVSFEGAGNDKQVIPSSALYRSSTGGNSTYLHPASYPANAVNGLDYSYFEGNWILLPEFVAIIPIKNGTTDNFDLSLSNRPNLFAVKYNGYIEVPQDGVYTFYTTSDDGSSLYIDNVLTVNNDGLHGAEERSGTIGLKAGKHLITALFFQQYGDKIFEVRYEGMGIDKTKIPASALYRSDIANTLPVANAGQDQFISLPSNAVTLTGSGYDADGTILTYEWTKLMGPGNISIKAANKSKTDVTGLVKGKYLYRFSVADNFGGKSSDTMQVTVNDFAAAKPETSTSVASSDTTGNLSVIVKGLQVLKNDLVVYPNPVKNFANLDISSVKPTIKLSISVINTNGIQMTIKTLVTTENKTLYKLDLSNMSDGFYAIVVRFEDGTTIIKKIIKKNF